MSEIKRVFFCPVGLTDPMGEEYDGPMLHIVRHYRPDLVYLFLTKEMTEYEERDSRYSRSILKLQPGCRVELIKRKEISDPSDFDVFIGEYKKQLDRIAAEYPAVEIIVNDTSGTPQMIMALSLDCVVHPANIKIIQVKAPNKRGNRFKKAEEFDLEMAFECNMDQLVDSENRCIELNLNIIKRNNLANDLRALVLNYEYYGALSLLQGREYLFDGMVSELLRYASLRERLKLQEAERILPDPYRREFLSGNNLVELFMIMSIQERQGRMAEYFLKLGPFCRELSLQYIEKILHFPILNTKNKDRALYDERRIREAEPRLYEKLTADTQRLFFKPLDVNLSKNLQIIEYFYHEGKMDGKDYWLFRYFRVFEELVRNRVAHEIEAVEPQRISRGLEKYFFEKYGRECEEYINSRVFNMTYLSSWLRELMCKVVAIQKTSYRFVYDDINKAIEKLL